MNDQTRPPERVEGLHTPLPGDAPQTDTSLPTTISDAAAARAERWVPTADAYRVRVWPSRRWGVIGPCGWRAQVDHVTNWDEHGDTPLFAGSGAWHRRQYEAVDWAVEEARLIHAGEGCLVCAGLGLTPWELPLVIQVGGIVLEDQRPDTETGGDLR